jgi:hypothetical protein
LASDSGLDRIELGDASERLGRDRRTGRLMHLVELAPRMRPAGRQLDSAGGGKPLEAWISVHLQDTCELRQVGSGSLGSTIRAVEIDGRWRIGSAPRPVITGIDPQPAGLGAAATGIKHGDWRVVGEQRLRGKDVLCEPRLQRLKPPDCTANPVGER